MALPYKELLLKIARKITRDELEEMKFLSDDFLPDIQPGSVLLREIFTFFRCLEDTNRLGENNLDWLEYLLKTVKGEDIASMFEDFQPTNDQKMNFPSAIQRETNDLDQSQLLRASEVGSKEENKDENKEENKKEENKKEENTEQKEEALKEGDLKLKKEKSAVADEDAAQKRKREKRRRYKKKKKAAKSLSNVKGDQSTSGTAGTVEQGNVQKEQKEPGKSGEVKKEQETPDGAGKQEFLDKEKHHGREKRLVPVDQKREAEKEGGAPAAREDRPPPANESQGHSSRDTTEVPKKENQVVKDDQKNKQGQPGMERVDKAAKNRKVPQKTEMPVRHPDLPTEVEMAIGDQCSSDASIRKMCILSLCNKWQIWGESVSVVNRELCLALARAGHVVACFVLKSTDFEKEEARKGNVQLIQCSEYPGIKSDDLQLLYHQEIQFIPDLVIGHGKVTGPASVFHSNKASCPRLHIIHDLPNECQRLDYIVANECDEENLASTADFVAAIGTLLKDKWSTIINREVIEIVPGLPELTTRNSISSPQCRCLVPAKFCSPDASGLRIAVKAVNYSSRREEQPRKATFIACNTESNGSLKPAKKILKDCDEETVNLKELTGINCQQAHFAIQGATVFLSPAKVEPFGVAALDAIAIGIPIFISSQSGLADTIRQHLNAKFHSCIIHVADACHEDEEDIDARIWSILLDKIALKPDEAFTTANDLRTQWKEKFTWDSAVRNLTHIFTKSGKLPSRSPTPLQSSVLANEISEACLSLVKGLNLFDKRQKFVLFLSPEDPQFLQNAAHLGFVHWAAVFDFDRESVTKGYLSSCQPFLENIGKPACRLLPPPKEDVMDNYNLSLPNGIPWILLQGVPDMERDIEGKYGWIQEILDLLKRRHPGTITLLVIWKSTEDKELIRKLCKILTKIQTARAWENSVSLQVLSTSEETDCRLEDTAKDWDVAIQNVEVAHFFDAIYSIATVDPVNQIDPDFSLPKRSNATGDIIFAALPPPSRWVDSVLEVLYAPIGNTPEFGKDDAHHFYRGGKISWYGIEMNYAVERQSWEPLKKTIKEELEYPGAAFLTLFHQRGAGGTTSARKLVYDFHLLYPCVCLKTINYETFLAIKVIWEFCSLPVIILADFNEAPGSEDNDIESLYGNLSNDKVSCLILHLVHRHYQADKRREKGSRSKETAVLAKPLTDEERVKFIEVYSLQSPTQKSELGRMRYEEDEKLQIPFYYGLIAFEDQFQGLESFVSACLQGLNDAQRKALCFLTMAFQYGRKELPLSALAGIFRLKPLQLHYIEDVLTPDSIDLLVEEYGWWRPRHCTIGEEMMRQLLTVPYGINRDNWQLNLAEKALEFVTYMEEDVTIDVLLNRISDEKTYKRFSTLVEHIPEGKDVVKVFEKAISVHPENPFLKAHFGRYYSVREGSQGFETALQYTDEAILLASKMSKNVRGQLTQMRGMIYKRQVKHQIESDEAILDDIISLAQEGVNAFTRAVGINPDKIEDSYIPQVRMMCDIFKYIDRTFEGGIFEYLKSSVAHRFILDGISETSDILESVSDSADYPYLRRDLFRIGVRRNSGKSGDKEDLIKHFQEIKKRCKTSIASVNRLIVVLHLELCKEKQKPVSEIAKVLMNLLEEALKYEKNNDHTMRIWTRVAPHVPVDLMGAESKIAAWCNQGKSVLSYLYRYIFTCIRIIEGGKDQKFEDDRLIAEDELLKSVRATNRVALRHPDRPVVFLGRGKGMGQLVTLEGESFKEVRKQRTISVTTELRRMTGIILKTGKVGQIKTDHGLSISFRADLCQPTPLLGESYLSRKVCFYLAFTYFGADAYNVRIIPG